MQVRSMPMLVLLLLSLLAVVPPVYATPETTEPESEPEPEPETPTEPEPEPEPETPPPPTEPAAPVEEPVPPTEEEEEALTSQDDLPLCDGSPRDCITNDGNICLEGQGGHECECEEDMSDCPNHPSVLEPPAAPVTEPREPLPYCDLVPRAAQNFACHDRRDYDDITGLYPCNDGTQEADFLDCEDVSGADYDEFLNQPPIDPCLLDPDNSPTCPPPDENGICPEGYNMNENGNCFPEHERCPTGYHSHEDDESGRCIPDSTPCDEGYIMNPSFPSCELKERVCSEFPNAQGCKSQSGGDDDDDDDDNTQRERHKTIIKNINIRNTIHNTADFPEVDVIGLGLRDNGDAMVCIMNIDNDWMQCQEFGVPDNRINEDVWRIIETDSDQDYDNGNTGSDEVDDAINAIKAYDFAELDSLNNHDFGVDLAALGINPIGEGLVCLVEDDRNEGTALCEPFKIDSAVVSGQITEITEFT